MRARVTELDKLIDSVEPDEAVGSRSLAADTHGVSDRRASLAADLQETRETAHHHQAEAVGALETIRLELLRMHAGAGSVESLTADLGAAQALAEDIERLLAGKHEVEELLGG